MPNSTTTIEQAQALLRSRLEEIEEERGRLERAAAELGRKVPGRRPGRPPGSRSKANGRTNAPKRQRKRRTGGRADQAVALIEASPGIGAADLAKQMKIKPNYLYRVLGELTKEGRAEKAGRGYLPAS